MVLYTLFQFAILTEMESDTISVRTITTPEDAEGENEEIKQLMVSNNGLQVYFSTEYAVRSAMMHVYIHVYMYDVLIAFNCGSSALACVGRVG